MTAGKTMDDALPRGVHIIEGCWATKALRIDGDAITVDMVRERINRAGLSSGFTPIDAFA